MSRPIPPPPSEFITKKPADWIPDAFPNAQKSTIQGMDMRTYKTPEDGDAGYYNNDLKYPAPRDGILITPGFQNRSDIIAHEAGHAIYIHDVKDDDRVTWNNLHLNQIALPAKEQIDAIKKYPHDSHHSFAEAWSQYATNPEALKAKAPDIYNYFVKISGFEYKREKRK